MFPDAFRTQTLQTHPRGPAVMRILAAALNAVAPAEAVHRFVHRQENDLVIDDQTYHLDKTRRILILGLGKAAQAMTQPLAELLADFHLSGLLIPKHAPVHPPCGFDLIPGGHPIPDVNSLRAGEKAIELVHDLTPDDLLICLISGGGSALVTAPHEGISLADMRTLTSALLACSARIDEINTLRRHLDRIKGGGLAKLASPARVVSLILSDVVNNPLEAIASGPTAPDPSTREAAQGVIEKYGLREKTPAAILRALENTPETPKPGAECFEKSPECDRSE